MMISPEAFEIYVHIPFCVKKCDYCDFLSAPASDDTIEAYTKALCKEIEAKAGQYEGVVVSSVYIGGGTPSVLPLSSLSKIIKTLTDSFKITDTKEKHKLRVFGKSKLKTVPPGVEFSMEVNPKTATFEKLREYKRLGVNRLSIGLQSADDKELKALGRIHGAEDFLETFSNAREAGFSNINIDLMQSVPYQTLSSWKKTLMCAASLSPEHISAYSLQIEEGTPFFERKKAGEDLHLPNEDEEREIYRQTKEILERFGYGRYEISNYAKPGFECRHNIGYWRRVPYLGLGLGASSFIGNERWKNTSELSLYLEKPGESRTEFQTLTKKDEMAEFMFLGLRLSEGISKADFEEKFKESYDGVYGAVTEKLLSQGLLEITNGESASRLSLNEKAVNTERVRLSERGIDVSNRVMAEFL